MFYILRKHWLNAAKTEVAEALSENTKLEASGEAPSDEPEIRPSRLFYVRRFGPIMGMCLYELDASLRASAGSADSETRAPYEPSMES